MQINRAVERIGEGRSSGGKRSEIMRIAPGQLADSITPSRMRNSNSETKPVATPVSPAAIDHPATASNPATLYFAAQAFM
ncbi:MAG: hypothetical protein ABI806_21410 [Candidatus Solibacter sp.]